MTALYMSSACIGLHAQLSHHIWDIDDVMDI